jgi:hypothetical protein
MFKFDLEDYTACNWSTKLQAENDGYTFLEKPDGTVSIYDANNVQTGFSNIETCCEKSGYEFDIENRKCLWKKTDCDLDDFKLIINPQGNTSALFDIDENETCCLDVSFDYKFKFDCDVLEEAINGVPTIVQTNSDKIVKLENDLNKIDIEISNINNRLISLYDVPFVIECTETNSIKPGTTFNGTTWGSWAKPPANWSNLYYKAPNNTWKDSTPPSSWSWSLPYFDNTRVKKYCLTDAGLLEWKKILGNDYQTWFNSDGTNTTIYDCKDIDSLENVASTSTDTLYSVNCNYTIYDKAKANKKITELEIELKKLTDSKDKITNDIASLKSQTQTIFLAGTCNSVIEFFENLNISFTLERLNTSNNRLETVYEESIFNIGNGNFWNYISNASGSTGIIISGSTGVMPTLNQGNYSPLAPFATSGKFNTTKFSDCLQFRKQITNEVYNIIPADEKTQLNSLDPKTLNDALSDWWQSCWLSYSSKICDVKLIQSLKGEKVNMSIKISNACADFSVLLDRVKMTKSCTKVDNVETFISEPPKFELTRIIDNKKSWIANRSRDDRFYDLKYRPAEYNTNHHRLVINTKEVDLNLSPARAVEQDVWCYMQDNNILNCAGATTGITSDEYYSHPVECSYSATCDVVKNIVDYPLPHDTMTDYSGIWTKDIFETYGACDTTYDCDEDENILYRANRDTYLKDLNEYNLIKNNGWSDAQNPKYPVTSISGLQQDTSVLGGYSIADIKNIPMVQWYHASAYTEYYTVSPSGNSLNVVFSGNDITFQPAVDSLTTLTGITGNPGDIRGVEPYSAGTYYFWNPLTNNWEDLSDGTNDVANLIGDLLTTRIGNRDARLKTYNEVILATRPFLFANKYIPDFQVKKYIL